MNGGYLASSGKYLDQSFALVCFSILVFFVVGPILQIVHPVPFFFALLIPQIVPLLVLLLCAGAAGPRELSFREKAGWNIRRPFPWKTVFVFFLFAYVLALILSNSVEKIASFYSIRLPDQAIAEILKNAPPVRFAAIAFSAVILAPLSEEWMYRHVFYSKLAYGTGSRTAAVLTSLLFALLHGSILHGPSLFCLAFLLQTAYRRTGGIAVPVLIHMLFNGASIIMLIFLKIR